MAVISGAKAATYKAVLPLNEKPMKPMRLRVDFGPRLQKRYFSLHVVHHLGQRQPMPESLVNQLVGSPAIVGAVAVVANERPTGQHDVTSASQPCPPPLLRLCVIGSRRGPGDHGRERPRALALRQQQQVVLQKILLDRDRQVNSRVPFLLPSAADHHLADIAEPPLIDR